ncbi:FAD-dependent oxidoreductase [Methylobacterium sp. JK268]
MSAQYPFSVAIVGAGPYGLSIAAHLSAAGIPHRIFGTPMRTWRQGMPAGMLLKSDGFASSLSAPGDAYPLAAYCAEHGIPYADTGWGVPVEVFAAYGEAFQRRFVPHLEEVTVRGIARAGAGFDLTLADGRIVGASHVVLATGLHPFAHTPPALADLPAGLVSHSGEAADLRHLAGRHVVVVGGGASALDVAASLHRAGARATVVARRDTLRFYPPRPPRRFEALRAPRTPLGPGWKKLLVARAPLLFRQLPAGMRIDLVRRHLGPAPAWSVKETIEAHVRVIGGARIEAARAQGRGVRLTVASGSGREVIEADHVVAATGFRIDLGRLGFLDPRLRGEIRCLEGSPVLSARFETSVPGLFMVGTPSAATFGPLLRFVCGAGFAARRLTGAFRRYRAVPAVPGPVEAGRAPRLAFLTLTDDIGSERIVAQLGREGAACAVVGAPDSYAAASRFAVHRLPLPRRGGSALARVATRLRLEELVRDWAPDRIVPLDDLAARVLRRLAAGSRISPALRDLIARSLGDPDAYALACSRDGLLTAAAARGLRIPATRPVPDLAQARAAAEALGYPVVLKREETCGSGGVTLVARAEDLAPAYAAARRRARHKRLFDRATALLSGEAMGERAGTALALQAFVPGRLAMRTILCREGRVLDGVSLVAVAQHPVPVGASTIVAAIDHPEMEAAASSLAAVLRLSGFVSFDFMLDAADRAHLIEMNPRPIGSTHLGGLFGHDLCRAFLADVAGRPAERSGDGPAWTGAVALFPRELMRDPAGARLADEAALRHDVPVDDPAVRERYLALLARHAPDRIAAIRALVDRPVPAAEPAPARRGALPDAA